MANVGQEAGLAASLIPGIGPVAGGLIAAGSTILGGDANKNAERAQAIQQLASQGNLTELEEWATGSGGDGSRANEPDASRVAAAEELAKLGVQVTPMDNGKPLSAASLNPSQAGALSTMGQALGVSGLAGLGGSGSPLSSLSGALTTGLGVSAANQESNQAQHQYNEANQVGEQNYNQTAGLRAQGINQMQNAVSQQPDLSAMFAAPSNPFSRSAPVSGTPLPSVSANSTGVGTTNPNGVSTAPATPKPPVAGISPTGQPLPAVSK